MLQDYFQKHVLTCLAPAFFIAGVIAVFLLQASILKYFGAGANKILSYGDNKHPLLMLTYLLSL